MCANGSAVFRTVRDCFPVQSVVTIDLNNVVVALHFRMVRSTARRVIHFQFDISANNLEIRAVQSPNV
jgi:hypothetical protein